ncbi:MAG TPA: alpha/beta fold hydrolase [Thermoanaerobaculia bacterium]
MATPKALRHVDLYTDAGRLEALYRDIESPVAVAVICHPHPLHGGTLHNKVVFRAARGLEAANLATLRFNFRGAGASHGEHDEGAGEQRDFEAALDWIMKRHPGKRVFAGGFSFGSWIASRVAVDRSEVEAIFLIGPPLKKYTMSYLRGCSKPMLFIQGSEDEFGDPEKLDALVGQCRDAESIVVTGADHFFAGQLEIVEEAMKEWAERVLET